MTPQQLEGLQKIVHDKAIRAFLDAYCEQRAAEMDHSCAKQMRPPSSPDIAAAYAAKAEVFEIFVSELDELERRK